MGLRLKASSNHRLVWTAVFAGLWITTAALSARAMESIDAGKAFIANKLPSQQQINQSYFNFTYRPFDRKDLTFDILIPADNWRDMPPTVSPKALEQDTTQLIPLAQQLAPENEKGNAKIQVTYTRMGLEISLYDFVSVFIEQNRLNVLLRREAIYNDRDVDEILVKSEQDTETHIIRIAFSRHGGRVFMVTCSALESEYGRFAQHFALAVVSFTVHQKAPQPYAESMAVFTGAGKPRLKFSYPESWECEAVEGSTPDRTGVNVNLVSRDEKNQLVTVYGCIHARAYAKAAGKTPEEILAGLKSDFEKDMFISYNQINLKADLMPGQTAPLGKLERWDVSVKETPGEVAFMVLPYGSNFLGMGLLSIKAEDSALSWLHAWRVFEIIANDLSGKQFNLAKLKNCTVPSNEQLIKLVDHTMTAFVSAVQEQNFNTFYGGVSNLLFVQSTPAKLLRAFKGFAKVPELSQISQYTPALKEGICIDTEATLTVGGYYPTTPDATIFEFTYIREQTDWKLLGINLVMKKMPQVDKQLSQKNNVLSTENGGQVVFCSSQYNQTSWGADNLIDGELGTKHGYASRNTDPVEIVFSLPRIETITQFCFNPYTIESSNTWAKLVKVEVSTQSPEKGFEPAGEFTLHNRRSRQAQTPLPDQCFDIPPTQAKYIKLHLLSNHGGNYIEMGEFMVYAAVK
ncbi:MAG: discoidin domain-containing protein [Desulfobacterales bacterium]|jgi:hypothetical protein